MPRPRTPKHKVITAQEHLLSDEDLAKANAEWQSSARHTIQGLAPTPPGYVRGWTGAQIWAAYRSEEPPCPPKPKD